MFSALVYGSSGPGSRCDREHCVVLLDKTLQSQSASLHSNSSLMHRWLYLNILLKWIGCRGIMTAAHFETPGPSCSKGG